MFETIISFWPGNIFPHVSYFVLTITLTSHLNLVPVVKPTSLLYTCCRNSLSSILKETSSPLKIPLHLALLSLDKTGATTNTLVPVYF